MEHTKRIAVPIPPEVDILGVLGVEDANLRALEADFPELSFWFSGGELRIQGPREDLREAKQAVQNLITAASETLFWRKNRGSTGGMPTRANQNNTTHNIGLGEWRVSAPSPDDGGLNHARQDNGGDEDTGLNRAGLNPVSNFLASDPTGAQNETASFAPRSQKEVRYSEKAILVNRERVIRPQTAGQARYVHSIDTHTVTFGIGPAGTGKTYLAMARAVRALLEGEVSRLILTRPAVEAGETLGFLPGTLTDKIDPYLRPLYDALREMLDPKTLTKMLADGTIEVAALAYMRGRTLNGAFVVLDEAQNTTSEQMKMFLTRLGFGSKMVVTGDITQIDLPLRQPSGLRQVQKILENVPDIAFSYLSAADVVRHTLVGEIIGAYQKYEETSEASHGANCANAS